MAVLVTGGAGYIGSHVAWQLAEEGRQVVIVDNLATGTREAVAGLPLIIGDCADEATVTAVIRRYRVDAAIHLAGLKSVADSMIDPAPYLSGNTSLTVGLLRTLAKLEVGRVVFSSSSAVYGSPSQLPVPESHPTDTVMHPYGESKVIGERALYWYARTSAMSSVALRYFNAAGAWVDRNIGESPQFSGSVFARTVEAAATGTKFTVFGSDYPTADGTAVRDYVHVRDVANAHSAALQFLETQPAGSTNAVNIGTGRGFSVREVVSAVSQAAGREVPFVFGPPRAGDPACSISDTSLARSLLGWSASRSLDEIAESAWQWRQRASG